AAALRNAEFATIRIRLIKIAARVVETASRIRIAFASACPDADIFQHIARALKPAPT
ncbi:transposase, partial [Sphingomonas sp. 37zxx]|uniref:transposase n=1 Tax=Sphingomonas sp. 37zxx TaxID=1550073 RepID=UPI00053C03DD